MNYGRQARTDFTGKPPYAPSAVPCEAMTLLDPDYEAREMTAEDIERAKNEYVNAAVLAAEVGYKIIQLHGAHGFLLAEFLSPHTNHRTDVYGGTPENRARIVVETIQEIRKALGDQVVIDVRVSGDEVLGEEGLQPKDFEKIVPLFEQAGMDLLNVSMCAGFDTPDVLIAGLEPQARYSYASRELREYASVPVGHAGFIGSLELGESLLEKGRMDLVGYGRTQFADNDFIRKCVEGRDKDIVKCIWCGECYQYLFGIGHSPSCCMVNRKYKCPKKAEEASS
jgi:2,4-dienoyl-CoA reductase-like NADH-dependent reductase (Old Yellow Enzyme family)